jgi:hypothetical protein
MGLLLSVVQWTGLLFCQFMLTSSSCANHTWEWIAPVNVPEGSTIQSLVFYFYKNWGLATLNITGELYAAPSFSFYPNAVVPIVSQQTYEPITGGATRTFTVNANYEVNNALNMLYVRVVYHINWTYGNCGETCYTDNLRFYGVQVGYSAPNPL